jgi:hypothetical protein
MKTISRPQGARGQAWECAEPSGQRGAVAFTERVAIGGTVSVGASKRGSRTAIPITGGSVSGRIEGSVRPGGADYQLLGEGLLDARYTLETSDGELIIVRNCGQASNLVPRFETRSDGPYAFVNQPSFLSSSPGISIGAVNITIYEAQ